MCFVVLSLCESSERRQSSARKVILQFSRLHLLVPYSPCCLKDASARKLCRGGTYLLASSMQQAHNDCNTCFMEQFRLNARSNTMFNRSFHEKDQGMYVYIYVPTCSHNELI